MKRLFVFLLVIMLVINTGVPVFASLSQSGDPSPAGGGSSGSPDSSSSSDDDDEISSSSSETYIPPSNTSSNSSSNSSNKDSESDSSGGGGVAPVLKGRGTYYKEDLDKINEKLDELIILNDDDVIPRVGQLISINNVAPDVIWKPQFSEIQEQIIPFVEAWGSYKALNLSSFDPYLYEKSIPNVYGGNFTGDPEIMNTLGKDIYLMNEYYISNGRGLVGTGAMSDWAISSPNSFSLTNGYHTVLPNEEYVTVDNFNTFMLKALKRYEVTFTAWSSDQAIHYNKERAVSDMSFKGIDADYHKVELESVHVFSSRSNADAYRKAFLDYFPEGLISLNDTMNMDINQSPLVNDDWQRKLTWADFFKLVYTYLHILTDEPVFTKQELATLIKLHASDLPQALTADTKLQILDLYARGVIAPSSGVVLSDYITLDEAMDIIMRATHKEKRYTLKNVQLTVDWKEVSDFAEQSVESVTTSFGSKEFMYEDNNFSVSLTNQEIPKIKVKSAYETYYIKVADKYVFKDATGSVVDYSTSSMGLLTGVKNELLTGIFARDGSTGGASRIYNDKLTGDNYLVLNIYKSDYLNKAKDVEPKLKDFDINSYWQDALQNIHLSNHFEKLSKLKPGLLINSYGSDDTPAWWYLQADGGGYYELTDTLTGDIPVFTKKSSLIDKGLKGYDSANSFYDEDEDDGLKGPKSNHTLGSTTSEFFGKSNMYYAPYIQSINNQVNATIINTQGDMFPLIYENDYFPEIKVQGLPQKSDTATSSNTTFFNRMGNLFLMIFKPLTVFADSPGPKPLKGSFKDYLSNLPMRALGVSTDPKKKPYSDDTTSELLNASVLSSFTSDDKYIRLSDLCGEQARVNNKLLNFQKNPTITFIPPNNTVLGGGYIITLKDAEGNETRITQCKYKQTISYNTVIIDYTDPKANKRLIYLEDGTSLKVSDFKKEEVESIQKEEDLKKYYIHFDVVLGKFGTVVGNATNNTQDSLNFASLTGTKFDTNKDLVLYVPEYIQQFNATERIHAPSINLSAIWANDGVIIPFIQPKNYLANYTLIISKSRSLPDKLVSAYPFDSIEGYNYNTVISSIEQTGIAGMVFETRENNNYDYRVIELSHSNASKNPTSNNSSRGIYGYGWLYGLGYYVTLTNDEMKNKMEDQLIALKQGSKTLDYGGFISSDAKLTLEILAKNTQSVNNVSSTGPIISIAPTFVGLTQFLTGYANASKNITQLLADKQIHTFLGSAKKLSGNEANYIFVPMRGDSFSWMSNTKENVYSLRDDIYSISPTGRDTLRVLNSNASNAAGFLYNIKKLETDSKVNSLDDFMKKVKEWDILNLYSWLIMLLAVVYLFVPIALIGIAVVLLCLSIIKQDSKTTTMLLDKIDLIYLFSFHSKKHYEFTILDGFKMSIFYVTFAMMIQNRILETLIIKCLEILEKFI